VVVGVKDMLKKLHIRLLVESVSKKMYLCC
jgi:hypothetical protein